MLDGCCPWPEEMADRYIARGYWDNVTLGDVLDRSARFFPKREALVGTSPVAGEVRDTFRDIKRKADRLALHFLRLGLRPLDRVIVQLPNFPEFVYLYFALHKIGAIPVMCLPPHRLSEVGYIARKTGARGYAIPLEFRGFNYLELAKDVREEAPDVEYVLVAGTEAPAGTTALAELLEEPLEEENEEDYLQAYRPNPMEVALFQLSGGTTGQQKVIPHTHNDYVCCCKFSAFMVGLNSYSIFLASAPVAHNFSLTAPGLNGAVYTGAKTVLALNPDPETVLSLVEAERITYLNGVPTMIINWLNHLEKGHYDLSSLKVIAGGGFRVNPELGRRVYERLGCRLQQNFGMGEGFHSCTRLDDPEEVILETQGSPLTPEDKFKIVDDNGVEVPQGEMGELWGKGPTTVRGYYRSEDHNREAFDPEGFYKTGDMVWQDKMGNLIVGGRKKDMINRGGEKISAEEIENLILGHPKVFNTAVVAMPDPVFGEKTCAYVIPHPGETLEFDELKAFLLQKQIAKFKLPERLEVVEELPLTSMNKVSKMALREDIAAKLAHEKGGLDFSG
ncbi:MAG: AMP-binding protein [Desulfatiglandales bacterium]|nr:AMP-binding protein [Desulfatiglandales bacterium]